MTRGLVLGPVEIDGNCLVTGLYMRRRGRIQIQTLGVAFPKYKSECLDCGYQVAFPSPTPKRQDIPDIISHGRVQTRSMQ